MKAVLDSSYSYLAGNAFGNDRRGHGTKEHSVPVSEMAAASLGTGDEDEYTAFVYYEFTLP